jgi:hypothetical protein
MEVKKERAQSVDVLAKDALTRPRFPALSSALSAGNTACIGPAHGKELPDSNGERCSDYPTGDESALRLCPPQRWRKFWKADSHGQKNARTTRGAETVYYNACRGPVPSNLP